MKLKAFFSGFWVFSILIFSAVAFADTDNVKNGSCILVPAVPTTGNHVSEEADDVRDDSAVELFQSTAQKYDLNPEESYLLAKIAMAEAEGQSVEGKALVILVVMNRVQSKIFPNTIEKVIYQKNQFSPISNGRFDRVEPDQGCWEALDLVLQGWDESRGALYFESKSESTWHRDNLKFLFKHEGHYFYTERECRQ